METIGSFFRKARKRRKISIERAVRETKIKKEYLLALEEEKFDELPADIYVRAFLNKYASYLGLNAENILELYKEKTPFTEKKGIALNYSKFLPHRHKKSCAGLLIILLTVTFIMFRLNRSRKELSPSLLPLPLKEEEVNEKILPRSPLTLRVKAIDDCSLTVREDNKIIFEDNLIKGEEKIWAKDKELILEISNAGGLELTVNGNFIGTVGKKGELIPSLVITPDEVYFNE